MKNVNMFLLFVVIFCVSLMISNIIQINRAYNKEQKQLDLRLERIRLNNKEINWVTDYSNGESYKWSEDGMVFLIKDAKDNVQEYLVSEPFNIKTEVGGTD